jgi:hypothetical protein
MNKIVEACGLSFSTNTVKKWMKSYFERVHEQLRIGNTSYLLIAVDEILCLKMSALAYGRSIDVKPVNGLYELTLNNIKDSINLNKELYYVFDRLKHKYDNGQNYLVDVGIKKQDMIVFIEKYAFGGGNIKIDSDALNFICFIIMQNRILLLDTVYYLTSYKQIKTLSDDALLYAIKINYKNELARDLLRKAEEVAHILRNQRNADVANPGVAGAEAGERAAEEGAAGAEAGMEAGAGEDAAVSPLIEE